MGNKHVLISIIVTVFTVSSCKNLDNPKERNIIAFRDSNISVTDSINVLNTILLKAGKQHYIYAVEKDKLFINDNSQYAKEVGLLSDTTLYKSNHLSFIDKLDRNRFVELVSYLNENHIDRCDFEYGHFIYAYRSELFMADRQIDLKRYIMTLKANQVFEISRYRILDYSGELYLLANKEAIIWEN